MHEPLRIAILECDTPIGKTKERYGGYGGVFKALLHSSAEEIRRKDGRPAPQLEITKFDVVNKQEYPKIDDVDAVLLSGSKYNAFDHDPWILKLVAFTEQLLNQQRVRLIGVCFGHQIIGRAMNVKVDRGNRGWEVSVVPVDLTDTGKRLFGVEKLNIHQMHRDIVYEYPPSVEKLGHTSVCEVQGMYSKDRLITVQGHPEFNGDIVSELLDTRHDQGIFDDKMYEDGMNRVRNHHDGIAVGAGFLRFLLDD